MTFSGDFTYFLLILARMSGCVFFNQIFGRGVLPVPFRISLSLFFAITVYGILPPEGDMVINTAGSYVLLIAKELFIGYLIGCIINMFFSTVVISGSILDMEMGLAMAQVYDPGSNISLGIVGSFLNIFLVLLFFSANGHLNLVRIFITSCKLISIGRVTIPRDLFLNVVEMFQQILVLALKLSMPMLAVGIILESGMGILMKAIPQIQVFTVNIQLKILVSLFLLTALVPVFSAFIEKLITIMFESIENSLSLLIT